MTADEDLTRPAGDWCLLLGLLVKSNLTINWLLVAGGWCWCWWLPSLIKTLSNQFMIILIRCRTWQGGLLAGQPCMEQPRLSDTIILTLQHLDPSSVMITGVYQCDHVNNADLRG